MLLEERDAKAGLPGNRARRWLLIARYEPEESCLARSVPADDPPAVTARGSDCEIREKRSSAELNRNM